MFHIIDALDSAQLEKFCALTPSLSLAAVAQQQADYHLLVANQANEIVARCSLWTKNTPPYLQHKLGVLGHYAATDASAAQELLRHACALLSAQGCTMVVGPMDGNTWQRYRFVTERGAEPAFFLEPENPAEWPQHFLLHGFTPISEYFSTLIPDLHKRAPRLAEKAAQMESIGVTIRSAAIAHFDLELAKIYDVARVAFQANFLYTPISQNEFTALYEPLKNFIQPQLILLAEQNNKCVGFLFALPNLAQAQRGASVDTFIVKTVAVLPDADFIGLGGLLVAHSHEIAAQLGYKRAIHALMHADNRSRGISKHYSQSLRRYALLGKEL